MAQNKTSSAPAAPQASVDSVWADDSPATPATAGRAGAAGRRSDLIAAAAQFTRGTATDRLKNLEARLAAAEADRGRVHAQVVTAEAALPDLVRDEPPAVVEALLAGTRPTIEERQAARRRVADLHALLDDLDSEIDVLTAVRSQFAFAARCETLSADLRRVLPKMAKVERAAEGLASAVAEAAPAVDAFAKAVAEVDNEKDYLGRQRPDLAPGLNLPFDSGAVLAALVGPWRRLMTRPMPTTPSAYEDWVNDLTAVRARYGG